MSNNNSALAEIWSESDVEVIEFPQWFECPECGHEGTSRDLKNFGHACCRNFLKELEDGYEWE